MMQWTRYCICHLKVGHYRRQLERHQVFHGLIEKLPYVNSLIHTSVHVTSQNNGQNDHSEDQTKVSSPHGKGIQKDEQPISVDKISEHRPVARHEEPLSAQYFESKWLSSSASYRQFSETDRISGLSTQAQHHQHNDDTDVFGNLEVQNLHSLDQRHPSERLSEQLPEEEKGRDFRLGIPLTRYGRIGKSAIYYTKKMSKLGKQGKTREAIYIYDELMMKRDRVLPKKRTFVTLIGILGRVGYTRKAFQLFREMKMLGFDAEDHIYTSLFNACANSPSTADGLARAEKFIRYLQENSIKPNLFTVKSCMKALAICGDFPRAFAVLDEAATRMRLDSECFNALLIACVSDKKAGFLRALLVWQKMLEMQIHPETSTFNLLLRCVRDCGIGEPEKFQHLLGHLTSDHHHSLESKNRPSAPQPLETFPLALESGDTSKVKSQYTLRNSEYTGKHRSLQRSHLEPVNEESCVSKLSRGSEAPKEYQTEDRVSSIGGKFAVFKKDHEWWEEDKVFDSSAISHVKIDVNNSQHEIELETQTNSKFSMKDLEKPEVRLALLGGSSKFLKAMSVSGAPPDVKTFTQLLSSVPNDEDSETGLLNTMEEMGAKPDIDFLNDIMMRRYRRRDYEAIDAVLIIMSNFGLSPNMRTYAALALTCNTRDKADQLFQDMKAAGIEPSVEVMSHLLLTSFSNYAYKLHLLKTFEALGYQPTTRMLTSIEKSIALSKGKIAQAEKDGDSNSFYLSETYITPFKYFLNYYRQWLQRTEISRPEHPWKAFEPSENNPERNSPDLETPRKQRL